MTIAMLALAGFPATAGFFGKVYLIEAAVDNGYTWLGVVIVLGSAISLAYYLRVVAAVWMRAPRGGARAVGRPGVPRPAIAGGSVEADADRTRSPRRSASWRPRLRAAGGRRRSRCVCAAATIFFGVYPSPLLDLAHDAGRWGCSTRRSVSASPRDAAGERRVARVAAATRGYAAVAVPRAPRAPILCAVRHDSGQASAEYVAILASSRCSWPAARGGRAGGRRAGLETVRTGLCIVGGDVCRSATQRRPGSRRA